MPSGHELPPSLPALPIGEPSWTKKRELVGNFRNAGVKWDREPVLVNDHDFRSDALGVAIPSSASATAGAAEEQRTNE